MKWPRRAYHNGADDYPAEDESESIILQPAEVRVCAQLCARPAEMRSVVAWSQLRD